MAQDWRYFFGGQDQNGQQARRVSGLGGARDMMWKSGRDSATPARDQMWRSGRDPAGEAVQFGGSGNSMSELFGVPLEDPPTMGGIAEYLKNKANLGNRGPEPGVGAFYDPGPVQEQWQPADQEMRAWTPGGMSQDDWATNPSNAHTFSAGTQGQPEAAAEAAPAGGLSEADFTAIMDRIMDQLLGAGWTPPGQGPGQGKSRVGGVGPASITRSPAAAGM